MPDVADLIAGRDAPLLVADLGAVRFVILNRPDARNAMTRAMRADFAVMLDEAEHDPAVGAIVLTGAGGTFSAGVDLKDRIPGAPPVEPNPARALRALTKPVVAAIHGACVTGAVEMALSCTFAIATPQARFADTHCKVGIFPRWGGGTMLVDAIGVRRARQMMLTGSFIDAPTALAWGLVNEIVPADTLLDRATALAEAMIGQANAHPLTFSLHADMLDAFAEHERHAHIEADALAAFDRHQAASLGAPTS